MAATEMEIGWQASMVLHRYCKAIDDRDAHALKDVFGEDVVLIVGGTTGARLLGDGLQQSFVGRDTVVELLMSLIQRRDWARHLVSNVLVEGSSDGGVDVRSYVQYILGEGATTTLGVGDYQVTMRASVLRRLGGRNAPPTAWSDHRLGTRELSPRGDGWARPDWVRVRQTRHRVTFKDVLKVLHVPPARCMRQDVRAVFV